MTHCPACQSVVELTPAGVCPNCGARPTDTQLKTASAFVGKPTRTRIPMKGHIGATVDRTGSSATFAVGIPLTLETILMLLAAQLASVTCTLASHGDLDEGQKFTVLTDAGTPEQAIKDAKSILFAGGGDPAESHLDAIESLLTIVAWPADPTRERGVILAFLTAETKSAKSGVTPAELGRRIRDKGLLLYLVCEPTPRLQELVQAAGGLMFEISNTPKPDELQQIAAQVAGSISHSVASGGTVAMTSYMA